MANEGQKWTEFYSASHLCSPSRAAILTGLYPVRTGTSSHVFFEWSAKGLPKTSQILSLSFCKKMAIRPTLLENGI